MSILERSTSPQAPDTGSRPPRDRLRVITAGSVGNMEARLGTSGFDVVAVTETEDALIDAVSADKPDAIVVEADLCASLEHIRDLAPDAVLVVVGDHTPAGALGRIERGVSGTTMAGLLHALVAEGIGAAAPWGLVPAIRSGATARVSQRVIGSLLSAKADLVRTYLGNTFHDHAELVIAASTAVAMTVSTGVLLTLSAPRTDARPERVSAPTPAVEPAPQNPVVAATSPIPRAPYDTSWEGSEPAERREPNDGESRDHGRHDAPGEGTVDPGEGTVDPGEGTVDPGEGTVDPGEGNHPGPDNHPGKDDQGKDDQGKDDQGKDEDEHGDDEDEQGDDEDEQGDDEDEQGDDEDEQGDDEDEQGDVDRGKDDHGTGDQGDDEDEQGDDGDETAQSNNKSDEGDQGDESQV